MTLLPSLPYRVPAAVLALLLATAPARAEEATPVADSVAAADAAEAEATPSEEKLRIGATADFVEKSSGIVYTARIDTGATTCSIHAEDIKVEGGNEKMIKNISKKVSFALVDANGKKKRVESVIVTTVKVKTSEEKERRYKVWLTLRHGGVERRVHVTLNDRAHMEYPLLIGRNFLRGRFLVDVSQKHSPLSPDAAAKEVAEQGDDGPDEKKEPIASQDVAEEKEANL